MSGNPLKNLVRGINCNSRNIWASQGVSFLVLTFLIIVSERERVGSFVHLHWKVHAQHSNIFTAA